MCQYYKLQLQPDYAAHFFLFRLGCTLARNSLSNSNNSSSSSSCIRQLCSSPSSSSSSTSTAGSRSSRRRTGWSPSGRRYSGGSLSNRPGEHSLLLFYNILGLLFAREYFSYLCTYYLYGPVRNGFDAGSIPLRGQLGGGWTLEIETFWPCEMASSRYIYRRVPFGAQKSQD